MKGIFSISIRLLGVMSALGFVPNSHADEPAIGTTETRIVLRISREFIRKHSLPPVAETSPVNKCLFGAHVTGQSHTTGVTTVNMDIEEGDAVFTFHFKGATITNSVATKHPVEVYSTGTTFFEAKRAIRFDGLRFSAEPASIQATHSSTIDGLCTPRGLRGVIARKRAWASIHQNKAAADAISLADTKALVMASFNRETEKLVKDLNAVAPLEQTVALLIPKTKDWVTHVGRTKDYIVVSPGPKEADIPVLPKEFLQLKAPMELWIHGKPGDDNLRKLVGTWGTVHRGLDRFRALTSSKEAKIDGLQFTAVGEWWVIKVGEDLLERWVEKIDDKSKSAK